MITHSEVFTFSDENIKQLAKKINAQVKKENLDTRVFAYIANTNYETVTYKDKLVFTALVTLHYQNKVK
ncbi:hypothetical protein KC099_11095 [Acinetobacter nosocomialis]|uniref:hypothetical protein n=1 Tax=Acinetobacter nosocomialis TaxID=106654 RepID=UPI001B823DC3|nr:hypothetical protein [Acinetobacter nosocomialis]MBR7713742.1 hypothetical protein [Acinetobacter nosocomialis]